jgi:glycosyltransferase involved in cell wall biosynthesis
LAKYLPKFGWEAIVLTAKHPEKPAPQFQVIETEYRDALGLWKRLIGAESGQLSLLAARARNLFGIKSEKSPLEYLLRTFASIVTYPDQYRGWHPYATKAGDEIIKQEKINALISITSGTNCLVAKDLKARYHVPWLANLQDLWSQNAYYIYGPIRRWLDRKLELKTLSQADALVTISEPLAKRLAMLHKGKPIYSIPNSFDPDEVNTPAAELTPKFTITYTGNIYLDKRNPSYLFAALRDLLSDGTIYPPDIEVRFYGPKLDILQKHIEDYQLDGMVKQYGMVPRDAALQAQRESQLLLLLDWDDLRELGISTSKIFEYLAARRPILATGGSKEGAVSRLLRETKTGSHCPGVEEVKVALKQAYETYKLEGRVGYHGEDIQINKYSHYEAARKYAEILDGIVSGKVGE